jgi:hypothetical protein
MPRFLLLLFLLVPATAQGRPDTMQIVRDSDKEKKRLIVARSMGLSDNHQFWKVYARYQEDLDKLHARLKKLVKSFVKSHAVLGDQEAKDTLDTYLAIEVEAAKLKQDYVKTYLKVLPPAKLLRYYQLENKFSAVLRYDLAQNIPLAR